MEAINKEIIIDPFWEYFNYMNPHLPKSVNLIAGSWRYYESGPSESYKYINTEIDVKIYDPSKHHREFDWDKIISRLEPKIFLTEVRRNIARQELNFTRYISKTLRSANTDFNVKHNLRMFVLGIESCQRNLSDLKPNPIQSSVIQLYLNFYPETINGLKRMYPDYFPKKLESVKINIIKPNLYPRIFTDEGYKFYELLKSDFIESKDDYAYVFRKFITDGFIFESVKHYEFIDFVFKTDSVELEKLKTINNIPTNKRDKRYCELKERINYRKLS